MLDYSTWGDAWGFSWGDAWGCVDAETPKSRGGYPWGSTSGKAKRFIRSQLPGEIYDNVNAALAALEAVKKAPTKRKIKRARKSIDVIQGFGSDVLSKPVSARVDRIPQDITPADVPRAMAELKFIMGVLADMDRQAKRSRRREDDALIAILLSI